MGRLRIRNYTVCCVVCKTERISRGHTFENAFFVACDDSESGWGARWSHSGEYIELLCPQHADLPPGDYDGQEPWMEP